MLDTTKPNTLACSTPSSSSAPASPTAPMTEIGCRRSPRRSSLSLPRKKAEQPSRAARLDAADPPIQPAAEDRGSRFKPRSAGITSLVEERASEARSQRGVGTESPSQARMHRRLRGRLPLGGLLGAIAGAMVGAVVGLLFFDRSAAILTSILASTVFGLGVGMLVAGYSSLESPDPGAEPSDTARPVADRPEVVREEHADPPVPNQMPED
jgi:hypothetical protein